MVFSDIIWIRRTSSAPPKEARLRQWFSSAILLTTQFKLFRSPEVRKPNRSVITIMLTLLVVLHDFSYEILKSLIRLSQDETNSLVSEVYRKTENKNWFPTITDRETISQTFFCKSAAMVYNSSCVLHFQTFCDRTYSLNSGWYVAKKQ